MPFVRKDDAGTTHIFKEYLAQISESSTTMEEYPVEIGGVATDCGKALAEESLSWGMVASGCENMRWPAAAHVWRPYGAGDFGLLQAVANTPGSIGYASLAEAREYGAFSRKGEGGENKKGVEGKTGEQHTRFWAEIQDTATPQVGGYTDPATNGDVEAKASANCPTTTNYSNGSGSFPVGSTRRSWSEVRAESVQKKSYALCGITYELALREYKPYYTNDPGETKNLRNYLLFQLDNKSEGGIALIKNHDYEKLLASVVKEAETGIKELGHNEE